jgi:hypothetical protein
VVCSKRGHFFFINPTTISQKMERGQLNAHDRGSLDRSYQNKGKKEKNPELLVAACWANLREKTCTPMVTRENISHKPQSRKSPRKASQELAGSNANMALPEVQTKLARFWNENYSRIWPTSKRFPTFCLARWNGHLCLLPPCADTTLLFPQPPQHGQIEIDSGPSFSWARGGSNGTRPRTTSM